RGRRRGAGPALPHGGLRRDGPGQPACAPPDARRRCRAVDRHAGAPSRGLTGSPGPVGRCHPGSPPRPVPSPTPSAPGCPVGPVPALAPPDRPPVRPNAPARGWSAASRPRPPARPRPCRQRKPLPSPSPRSYVSGRPESLGELGEPAGTTIGSPLGRADFTITCHDVTMRERFRNDLTLIADLLVEMADGARAALRQATSSLLHSDADQARLVIAGDEEIDAQYRNIEEKVYEVIALQAPVASDLRLVLTALHIAGDLERMGDLAVHVAKTGLRRHPSPAVPEELTGIVREMGSVADQMAGKISR